jgi:hypothetical protein
LEDYSLPPSADLHPECLPERISRALPHDSDTNLQRLLHQTARAIGECLLARGAARAAGE